MATDPDFKVGWGEVFHGTSRTPDIDYAPDELVPLTLYDERVLTALESIAASLRRIAERPAEPYRFSDSFSASRIPDVPYPSVTINPTLHHEE